MNKRKMGLVFDPITKCEIYHTGASRNPEALREKWLEQIIREDNEGVLGEDVRYNLLKSKQIFDYSGYKGIWPKSRLVRVNDNELPEILRVNKNRFAWHQFSDFELSNSKS